MQLQGIHVFYQYNWWVFLLICVCTRNE